ncbi:MAG: alpha/beta hydrolase [Candidatus Riflebacteria bacterium]|nr:alpha/beta hydrolase [Candidatus Riflebacteria bacterium]
MNNISKRIVNVLLILSCFAFLVFFLQNKIIFHPFALEGPPVLPVPEFPQLKWENHIFQNSLGNNISAVFLRNESVKETSSKTVILFSHGNAGNNTHRFSKMNIIASLPADIMIYDYSGFGYSSGSADVKTSIEDGLAALKYLKDKFGIDSKQVILYGESIGTGVTACIANRISWNIRGIVLESGFASLKARAAKKIPIIGPIVLVNDYPVDQLLSEYNGPLFIIHSEEDEINPYSDSQKVYEKCPSQKKHFLTLKKYSHNYPIHNDFNYLPAWKKFIESL